MGLRVFPVPVLRLALNDRKGLQSKGRTRVDRKRRKMCRKMLEVWEGRDRISGGRGDIDDTVDAFKTNEIAMRDEGERTGVDRKRRRMCRRR